LSRRLELVFITTGGGRMQIGLADPKQDLTAAEVEAAMNVIIEKNIFSATTGDAASILSARVVTRDTEEIISL